MGHAEEITILDEARTSAKRRLEECEREIALTEDLDARQDEASEAQRRRRKLITRRRRYRKLVRRLLDGAGTARRRRLDALVSVDVPKLKEEACRLHRQAHKLETALEKRREQYRGLQMRHLALEREALDLSDKLGEAFTAAVEPPEIKRMLGQYRPEEEV